MVFSRLLRCKEFELLLTHKALHVQTLLYLKELIVPCPFCRCVWPTVCLRAMFVLTLSHLVKNVQSLLVYECQILLDLQFFVIYQLRSVKLHVPWSSWESLLTCVRRPVHLTVGDIADAVANVVAIW